MAKIGTAHIEIKPVLNDAAVDDLVKRIEDAVAEGVRRGIKSATTTQVKVDGRVAGQIVQAGLAHRSATS